MKKFLLSFIISLLTFAVGVFIYRNSTPKVSLETISKHTWFYDGMNVEIESYAQVLHFDENSWYVGEPSEKRYAMTYLDLENNTTNLDNLHSELKTELSEKKYKRAKILVKGKVKDNCKTYYENGAISFGCCFGRSITIKTQEVIQLAPVENYTRPQ